MPRTFKNVSPWQEVEEKFIDDSQKKEGYRLGCCAKIEGDLLLFVPEESRAGKQVVSKAARDIKIEHNPAVKLYYVEVLPPTFEEPTADFERVCDVLNKQFGLKNLTIDLHATSNFFGPGHRIRLEVSSSNFPRFDRNLNTGGNNFDETEWKVAKNTVHHSKKYPSHIILSIVK